MSLLKSLFSSKSTAWLGLDLSATSIKLVELSQGRSGQLTLERCLIEPLPEGLVVDGMVEQFDALSEILSRMLKASGTKAKQAVTALPSSTVITKKIMLPDGLSPEEFDTQVEAEAARYIPFAIEEVSLDYAVMPSGVSMTGDIEVMIVATRKEKIEDRAGILESVGLEAVVVDVESFASRMAALRVLALRSDITPDHLIAVIEVGGSATRLQVLKGEQVVFEREQPFGGEQLTQAMMKAYKIDHGIAESWKRNGEWPEGYEATVMQPYVQNLTQEIERALQFFFTGTPFHKVDEIYLSGGAVQVPGLAQAVTEATGVISRLMDPFAQMQIGKTVNERRLRREAPAYLTACGLALRKFVS